MKTFVSCKLNFTKLKQNEILEINIKFKRITPNKGTKKNNTYNNYFIDFYSTIFTISFCASGMIKMQKYIAVLRKFKLYYYI